MKTFYLIVSILILSGISLAVSEQKEVIYVQEMFDCNPQKLLETDEGEMYKIYIGRVSKISENEIIVKAMQDRRNLFFNIATNRDDLKIGDFLTLFLNEETNKVCLSARKIKKRGK